MTIKARLYGWNAKRAGAGITITHGTGKIVGFKEILSFNGKCLAKHNDGSIYELCSIGPQP